jgi:hypothetical protein
MHVFGGYDGSKPVAGDVFTLDCSSPASMEGKEEGKEEGGKKKKEEEKKEEDDE